MKFLSIWFWRVLYITLAYLSFVGISYATNILLFAIWITNITSNVISCTALYAFFSDDEEKRALAQEFHDDFSWSSLLVLCFCVAMGWRLTIILLFFTLSLFFWTKQEANNILAQAKVGE